MSVWEQYIVRPTKTSRGETRWMVISPGNWVVNRRHLTRKAAVLQAATLATIHDPRYLAMVEEYNRLRAEIIGEHEASIDATSEKEAE